MKEFWKEIRTAIFMGFLLPAMLLWFGTALLDMQQEEEIVQPAQPQSAAEGTKVPVRTGEEVEDQLLEEYLVGVVLAEMPASFEPDALTAQAVVARTYTMRTNRTVGKHGDGSICTDPACCQAYIAPQEYLDKGGTQENMEKIRKAVEATAGQVLTYDGQLIEATYFSCSGGSTEDAVAVWGNEYPYLTAVDSPGEEQAAHYTDTVHFTPEQFCHALGETPAGNPAEWFGPVTYTQGGGVDTMVIGEKTYQGTQLRKLLSLRSTAFTVTVGSQITITTRGFGHRVGMSQYGADAMALNGSTYPQILAHYYRGTSLSMLENG